MSGGYFDYKQYYITDIAESIELFLKNENDFSKATIDEFKTAIKLLNKAAVYAQRIDWLISSDDGEESFHERLKEELEEIDNANI
jgi:hypothetical protein